MKVTYHTLKEEEENERKGKKAQWASILLFVMVFAVGIGLAFFVKLGHPVLVETLVIVGVILGQFVAIALFTAYALPKRHESAFWILLLKSSPEVLEGSVNLIGSPTTIASGIHLTEIEIETKEGKRTLYVDQENGSLPPLGRPLRIEKSGEVLLSYEEIA